MRRSGLAVAVCLAMLGALHGTAARADVPKAAVDGDLDKSLRAEIQRAVGDVKVRPESSFDARRRALEAVDDVIAVLRSEGYYAYHVEADVTEAEPPEPVVHVTPGPRFRIKDPAVDWVAPAPIPEVAKAGESAVALTPGAPGRAADILAAEGRIVASAEKRGYADAEARPREVIVDHADHSVKPTFRIAAGDLVRLDGVTVITDGRTNPAWVKGLAPWKSGQPYDPDKVAELERRLTDVAVYDSVTVSLATKDKDVGGLRPVIVSLSDRPRHTIELGAGFSTGQGSTVNELVGGVNTAVGSGVDGKWITYNRLGRADSLTFTARLYDIQQKLDAELDLPHWRRPGQTLKLGGDVFRDRTTAFDDAGAGVRADVERRFTRTSYVTVGAALDYVATQEKTAVNPLSTPVGENLKLGIATGLVGFALDRSNDILNPVRGWRLDVRAEPTAITGDRSLAYVKTQAQASIYLPLNASGGTVIAGRLKLGAMLGGKLPDVPADRRFFAGGGGSVRGYAYQAVGPRLSDNTPSGGLSLFETSLEVRQRITNRWGVVAFVDAGSVGVKQTPDFGNFSTGVGIGLRYDLGFGPFRLDIATPVNRRKGDAAFQAYISIGQSF